MADESCVALGTNLALKFSDADLVRCMRHAYLVLSQQAVLIAADLARKESLTIGDIVQDDGSGIDQSFGSILNRVRRETGKE